MPARIYRRRCSRICAGSGSAGTASRWSSRSGPRPTPPRSSGCATRAGLSLFLHPRRHRRLADRAARRCRQPAIPAPAAACPTIPSAARRRRTAGGSTARRRSRWPACRRGARRTGRASTAKASDIGDAILARKDAPAAYHLACVVDDAASGVNLVVRGADLRPSTPVQRLLQQLLGLPEPSLSPPPAGGPRRRPAPRQARPGADPGGDARGRRRRASAGRRSRRRPPAPRIPLRRGLDSRP